MTTDSGRALREPALVFDQAPAGLDPSGFDPARVPLRIWWIPQLPMKAFEVDVPDLASADLLLSTLAKYDAFQFEHNVKGDYCNAGGLLMLEDGEWVDWYDDAMNCDFDEWREVHGARARDRDRDTEGDETRSGSVERSEIEPGPQGIAHPTPRSHQ